MAQRFLISALSLALVGVLVLLSVAAVQRLTATNSFGDAAVGSFGERPTRPPNPQVPELQFETEWDGLTESDWAEINRTVGEIRSKLLESINDDFQGSLDDEVQETFESPQGLSRRGLDEMTRYRSDPDRPTDPDK